MTEPVYRGYSSVGRNSIDTSIFDIELVKQDILNHFMTRLGERVGRPTFGSIIHDLIFDVGDDRTEALVIQDAERIISQDPRVELLDLVVDMSVETHEILISIRCLFVEFNMEENFHVTFRQQLAT